MCWYKIMYQVLPVAWTNRITTRSDTGSHNRLDLIHSLVPPHYIYNGYVYRQYMYIVGKYKFYLYKLFCLVSRVLIYYIFSDNLHKLCLSCNVKKPKTIAKLSKKSRKKCHFLWCLLWSQRLYRFLPLLNMNKVPGKLYLGQWLYIKINYPVNAIWLLK